MPSNKTYLLIAIEPKPGVEYHDIVKTVKDILTLSTPNLVLCEKISQSAAATAIVSTKPE